jgi:hypothetical protein
MFIRLTNIYTVELQTLLKRKAFFDLNLAFILHYLHKYRDDFPAKFLERIFMWSKKIIERSLAIASLSAVIIGCGSAPQPGITAIASVLPPTATTTQPVTGTNPNLNGAYNFNFQLQDTAMSCNNEKSPTPAGVHVGTYATAGISTDNIFKVTLSSGSHTTIPCTGASAAYSCLQYTVTVGSRSETVQVSYGNPQYGPCAGVPSSKTLDFSDQAGPGHGPLVVKVTQPQSDNCRTQGYPYYWGCGMAPLYSNYIGAGSLSVVTNQAN